MKEVEEATLKKVKIVEMAFKGEKYLSCCRGEEAVVPEKGEREKGAHRAMYKENISPEPLAWKTRGAKVWGDYLLLSEYFPKWQLSGRHISRNKEPG